LTDTLDQLTLTLLDDVVALRAVTPGTELVPGIATATAADAAALPAASTATTR
jgi:hypothetical protein